MSTSKSKQLFRVVLLSATVISLFFVPWLLVKAWILPLPDSLQAQAEQAVSHGFDGVIIYVDQGGKAPQQVAAGWHNRDTKVPATPTALFKIASIGKLYDAVALTKLVSDGRLSLDKTVAEYLPELTDDIVNAESVTLRNLVQHRSGIPNYTDSPGFWGSPTNGFGESLALIKGLPANFEPGEDYEYCNTNYLLLNKIVSDELGYDNFQFFEEEILIPLNLTNTFRALSEVDTNLVMSGYHKGYPYDLKQEEFGMLATAQDVATFLRALNDGSVFEGDEADIYASIYEYKHSGWVPGYQSFAEYHEEIDAVTIEFYSTTDEKLYNWNLSQIINNRIVKILKKQ